MSRKLLIVEVSTTTFFPPPQGLKWEINSMQKTVIEVLDYAFNNIYILICLPGTNVIQLHKILVLCFLDTDTMQLKTVRMLYVE